MKAQVRNKLINLLNNYQFKRYEVYLDDSKDVCIKTDILNSNFFRHVEPFLKRHELGYSIIPKYPHDLQVCFFEYK